jgi:hypothetical protein
MSLASSRRTEPSETAARQTREIVVNQGTLRVEIDWISIDITSLCKRPICIYVDIRYDVCMYVSIVSMNLVHDFPIETRGVKVFGKALWPRVGVGGCRRMFEIQRILSESLQQRSAAVASEMDSMCLGIAEGNKCRGIA